LFVLFAGLHWPTFTSGTVRLCEYRLQSSCYYRENYFSLGNRPPTAESVAEFISGLILPIEQPLL
jgi:hypothetical protein